ncbi:MAG: hypothetical protein IKO10_15495, partial [Lachnospiraceae bacterium]|nr:hypothetical protein [Lachnospiraceae bacterium]
TEGIHNLHLEWELPLAEDAAWRQSGICTITPFVRDEGHDQYTQLADHIFRQDIPASGYLWLQGSGKIRTVALQLAFSEQGALQCHRIVVNARQPFQLQPIRLLVVFLLLLGLEGLRKASWNLPAVAGKVGRKEILIAICIGVSLILPAAILTGADEYKRLDQHFRPYQQLAEAFAVGQVSLLTEPSEAIRAMENPYDYTARVALGLEEGTDYLWDTAYYKGYYYVYFGVIPCLLFYLPVWLLLKVHMTERLVMLICAVLFYVGIWFLIRSLCRRYYKDIPYVMQMIAVLTVFLGSNMPACLSNPDAHDVPRICGIAILVWGLYFWNAAVPEEGGRMHLSRLAIGSLFMALAVGCRPNLALYSLLAPVLFWNYRKAEGNTEKKALYRRYLALLGPYIPVAIGLMIYNQVRFGSPFDFGFAYNLTMQDCSRTVVSLDKLFLGIYGYLLKLPQMDYRFPFIVPEAFAELNGYGHTTVYLTYCYGGLLVCNLMTWCIPVLFVKENRRQAGSMAAISMTGIVLAELLITALTGGISYNYMADFAFPLLIAAWCAVFLSWGQVKDTKAMGLFRGFLYLALIWSLWFHGQFYFQSTLNVGNTELYYRIFYAFNFF